MLGSRGVKYAQIIPQKQQTKISLTYTETRPQIISSYNHAMQINQWFYKTISLNQ